MFYKMIENKCTQWYESERCTVKNLIEYIEKTGQMRDAQIEAKYIVKLKVDYIKHNTTVAFPTILFVKNEIDEIPYKITSKNNPDVVEGCIKVKS